MQDEEAKENVIQEGLGTELVLEVKIPKERSSSSVARSNADSNGSGHRKILRGLPPKRPREINDLNLGSSGQTTNNT